MNRQTNTLRSESGNVPRPVFELFHSEQLRNTTHRPIPAPEPNPEPNPEPDTAQGHTPTLIKPSDWDAVFCAVLERLEHCVDQAAVNTHPLYLHQAHVPLDPRQVVKTTVLECVAAMRQLHAALLLEREQR
jgi:hypothetical protein